MTIVKTIALAALGAVMAGSLATGALAETPFHQSHPRRAEVNHRLATENHAIHKERQAGLIGPARARALHRQTRMIRRVQRIDARFDHGHITKSEQHTLNHQENEVNRELIR